MCLCLVSYAETSRGSGLARSPCEACGQWGDGPHRCGQAPPDGQPQAAEPSDFEADLVAVLVVAELEDESAEVVEDELPDSLDTEAVLVEPEPWESLSEPCDDPWRESLPELLSELFSEFLSDPCSLLRREPPRESLRESLR